jgi:molecular chaperone DnaK (HSP70)
MPSVVSYNAPPHGRTVVGAAAAALRSERPVWTVHDSKRLIGRAFADPLVQQEAAHLPYGVVAGGADGQTAALEVGGPAFGGGPAVTPEAVAATLLRQLKRAAERARPVASLLGFSFGSATVSVPVAFDRRQRAATLAAGRAAGFRLVRLLEEPVAAAVAYGLHDSGGERTVVVYDMGGGTLDVAVLRLERASRTFLVMATAGDPHLGGEDFDRALAVRVPSASLRVCFWAHALRRCRPGCARARRWLT